MWKLNNTGIAYNKKHKNDIIDIWNEDSKCIYKELIENENIMMNIATYGKQELSNCTERAFWQWYSYWRKSKNQWNIQE